MYIDPPETLERAQQDRWRAWLAALASLHPVIVAAEMTLGCSGRCVRVEFRPSEAGGLEAGEVVVDEGLEMAENGRMKLCFDAPLQAFRLIQLAELLPDARVHCRTLFFIEEGELHSAEEDGRGLRFDVLG